MNISKKANDKAIEKLGFKAGKAPERSRIKKIQETVGLPGSSGIAKKRMTKKCSDDAGSLCSEGDVKQLRKKRKKTEHVNRINKHYAKKSKRGEKASKPKIRKVVSDVSRKRRT